MPCLVGFYANSIRDLERRSVVCGRGRSDFPRSRVGAVTCHRAVTQCATFRQRPGDGHDSGAAVIACAAHPLCRQQLRRARTSAMLSPPARVAINVTGVTARRRQHRPRAVFKQAVAGYTCDG